MAKAQTPYRDPSFEEFVKQELERDPSLLPSQLQEAYVNFCAAARAAAAKGK
jgi:hypothetical protein